MKTTPEVKRMNMNLPKQLHDQFKATTAARGERMTDVLLEYIAQYVKQYGLQPKKGRR
jgi:ParG